MQNAGGGGVCGIAQVVRGDLWHPLPPLLQKPAIFGRLFVVDASKIAVRYRGFVACTRALCILRSSPGVPVALCCPVMGWSGLTGYPVICLCGGLLKKNQCLYCRCIPSLYSHKNRESLGEVNSILFHYFPVICMSAWHRAC